MAHGPLALVGGGEFTDGCTFDRELLDAAGGAEVLVLPTGAAYEHPGRLVTRAESWFASIGGTARGLDVLRRPDALDASNVDAVRSARFVYLAGESPMHLRSVLKDTPLWDALVAAWVDGAVVAGSAAGAMALCDPMVDPRGGAFTLGLGLIDGLTVIPEFETWSHDAVHRTRKLCPAELALVGVPTASALIADGDGRWRSAGAATVSVFRNNEVVEIDTLAVVPAG